jgi:hypothetical protein
MNWLGRPVVFRHLLDSRCCQLRRSSPVAAPVLRGFKIPLRDGVMLMRPEGYAALRSVSTPFDMLWDRT